MSANPIPVGLAPRPPSASVEGVLFEGLPSPTEGEVLVQGFLARQRELTAVERFAQRHADAQAPTRERFYRQRLPARPPGPGEQYAFEVDLDSCSGCKACVTACHRMNGLEEGESWRRVGALHGTTSCGTAPYLQTVTHACHHCVDPACMAGCPVDAYEKDPDTGIVRHLDDQCIGCQYCVFTCPYEVPRLSADKGIVRKCDMCSERLAEGEAPACVQGCPHGAIAITVVSAEGARERAAAGEALPAAPDPRVSVPTTIYKSRETVPEGARPTDYHAARVRPGHGPLAWMLVLTQLSVGALLCDMLLAGSAGPWHAALAVLTGLAALGASVLHLGRPRYAWRALIGLRHSWLSREIAAFGAFAGAAVLYALIGLGSDAGPPAWLAAGVALAGLAGVGASVMVYVATRRRIWRASRTAGRFVGTALVLGLIGTATSRTLAGLPSEQLWLLAGVAGLAKLTWEVSHLRHHHTGRESVEGRAAGLLLGPLRGWTSARLVLGVLGVAFAPLALSMGTLSPGATVALALVGMAAALAGELVERHLFFVAAAGPAMPGDRL